MEEQWNVIYVDRISDREPDLPDARAKAGKPLSFTPATSTANHDEVLRIIGPGGVVISRASIFDWIEKNAVVRQCASPLFMLILSLRRQITT